MIFLSCLHLFPHLACTDRKPPGVGRGRGRGREEIGGRPFKGIGRGQEDGSKGMGGSRGRGGPGSKGGGSRGIYSPFGFVKYV